jgi:hypothetical protein
MRSNGYAHALVYQALDQVLADGVICAGTPRAMYVAVDTLRASAAPEEHVRSAENIAIEIHRLQWALQRSNRLESQSALSELKRLAVHWVDMSIRGYDRTV